MITARKTIVIFMTLAIFCGRGDNILGFDEEEIN